MVRLGAVVMNVSDLDRASAFWSEALGYRRHPKNPAFLMPEGASGTRVHLDEEDRMHLDLWADDEADQQAQVERLIALGAQRVEWEYPDDADFVVLADPEGTSSASSPEHYNGGSTAHSENRVYPDGESVRWSESKPGTITTWTSWFSMKTCLASPGVEEPRPRHPTSLGGREPVARPGWGALADRVRDEPAGCRAGHASDRGARKRCARLVQRSLAPRPRVARGLGDDRGKTGELCVGPNPGGDASRL
jgi:catechol 2,3-dioxygenase-like lactoylglutathione lyase family enzyme